MIRASPALSSTTLAAPISRLLIVGQYLIGHLCYRQVSRPPQNLLIKWRSYTGHEPSPRSPSNPTPTKRQLEN